MAQIGSTTKSVSSPDWGSGSYTYKLTIDENSTNTTNNSHNVTVTFQILAVKSYYTSQRDTDATFSITTDASANINADSAVNSGYHSTSYNNWVTIGTWTGDLTGKADGSLSITASVTYGWASSYLPNNTTISLTASATTIPRASDIAVAPTIQMGSNVSITVIQKSAMFSHRLYYKLGTMSDYALIGQSSQVASKTWSFTVPDVSDSLPNSSSTPCTFRCDTYSNINYLGTAMESTASSTALVPSNYTPTISYVSNSATEQSSTVKAASGWSASTWPFIQGYSIVSVQSDASGSHGSTVTTRTLKLGSESITQSGTGRVTTTFTSVLANTSNTLKLSVLDSRGRPGNGPDASISAVAYTKPTVKINVARCLQNGTINALGTYAKVSLTWKWSSIKKTSSSSELNSATIKVYAGSSTTASITYNTSTNNQTSWVRMTTYPGTYATNTSVTFRAVITDKLSSNEDQTVLSKAEMPLSTYDAGNGVGITFGQMATETGFNIRLNTRAVDANVFDFLHNGKVSLSYASDHIKHGLYSSGYSSNGTSLTSSGKWLIYRDSNGNTVLNNGVTTGGTATPIYLNEGVPTSVLTPAKYNWFRGVPNVGADGVMEIGKYIDFHSTTGTDADYDARLFVDGTTLKISGTSPNTGTIVTSNNWSSIIKPSRTDTYKLAGLVGVSISTTQIRLQIPIPSGYSNVSVAQTSTKTANLDYNGTDASFTFSAVAVGEKNPASVWVLLTTSGLTAYRTYGFRNGEISITLS